MDFLTGKEVAGIRRDLRNGEAMQEAIDSLESAVSSCEEIEDYLTEAQEQ